MHGLLFSAALVLTQSLALALPHNVAARQATSSGGPNTTAVYYVGTANSVAGPNSDGCDMAVASGNITAQSCFQLYTNGIRIFQSPTADCELQLYSNTPSCDVTEGQESITQIPSGNSSVCFSTGVYDGGRFQKASAIWSCTS